MVPSLLTRKVLTLRVAMPNKGALAEQSARLMREAGYRVRRESKELVVVDAEQHIELFYLRPRDIAVYVGRGHLEEPSGLDGQRVQLPPEGLLDPHRQRCRVGQPETAREPLRRQSPR